MSLRGRISVTSLSSVFPNGLRQPSSIVRTLRSGLLPCRKLLLSTHRGFWYIVHQYIVDTTYGFTLTYNNPFHANPDLSTQEYMYMYNYVHCSGRFYTDGPSMSLCSFRTWTYQEAARQRHPIRSEHCSGE